jgi:hypothetical protein
MTRRSPRAGGSSQERPRLAGGAAGSGKTEVELLHRASLGGQGNGFLSPEAHSRLTRIRDSERRGSALRLLALGFEKPSRLHRGGFRLLATAHGREMALAACHCDG